MLTDILAHFLWLYNLRNILFTHIEIMETLTIKPPKGISLEDARIALERLNFQIVEEQISFFIPEHYKKELHRRNEELETHPETGIS